MEQKNIDMLMGISLEVRAELGRCGMRVRDVLQIGTGSIVELDRPTQTPIDLFVNEKIVARGEIVAVNEKFGVHITELVK